MSNFTDALEPTKKGILTKARENYEQATTIRELAEKTRKQFLNTWNALPEHLQEFVAIHQKHLNSRFYQTMTIMFNDLERDGSYPPLLCEYGRHLIREVLSASRTLSDKRQFYDALITLLTFLGKKIK